MAESDAGRRATGTVSTEEAERLSERFRPSWEDDPPTLPREPLAPRATPPVVAIPVASPAAAPRPVAERIPTLAGIPAPASGGGPGKASDDLDWDVEVPTRPVPPAADLEATLSPADVAPAPRLQPAPVTTAQPVAAPAPSEPEATFHVEVEELPPESKPSGIGEKYVPKEEGAPPVVLNEDVRVAELGAQAQRDAQHRARRAPTIAKMKAIDLPSTLVSADPFVPPGKSRAGRVIGIALVLLVAAGGAAALLVRGKPATEQAAAPVAPLAAKVVPDTAAPPPPALPSDTAASTASPPAPDSADRPSSEAPASSAASAAPEPSAAPAEAAPEVAPHAKPSKAASPAPKPAPAPRPPPTPRAAPTAVKPPPKPAAPAPKAPGGKGVIVRDTPF